MMIPLRFSTRILFPPKLPMLKELVVKCKRVVSSNSNVEVFTSAIKKKMICNYIPDGSLTRMSTVSGKMDVEASAKGLNTGDGQKKKQEGAGLNEAGEKSKG
jgi:hypothetical protein